MSKYIKFNGITFSHDSVFPFYSFLPNEGTTEHQSDKAVGIDGSIISNARYAERIVPLKGHIIAEDEKELTENIQKLFLKCNGKTKADLIYFDGYNIYFSEAVASLPTLSEKRGLCYEFNINFTLPHFYWLEAEATNVPLFERKNMTLTEFTLPCVFTQRTAGAVLFNEKDFSVFPIIEFISVLDGEYNLVIKNETTGATIELLNYTLAKDDKVIIDLEKVTATKNGENIINAFNDFTEFCLVCGNNNITVQNNGEILNSTILLYYNERKIGI